MDDHGPVRSSEPPHASTLEALYERYCSAIYRFIYSKVGNREEAEDLTSQVFLKAVRGLDDARDPQSAQSWLFHVARTTIADHWRAFYQLPGRSLDDMLDMGWEGPLQAIAAGASDGSTAECVQRILASLPDRYREVLTYRFLLNLSVKETAARMGLSEANVKVLQFRALKKASQMPTADCANHLATHTPDYGANHATNHANGAHGVAHNGVAHNPVAHNGVAHTSARNEWPETQGHVGGPTPWPEKSEPQRANTSDFTGRYQSGGHRGDHE